MTLEIKFEGDNGYVFESTVSVPPKDFAELSAEDFAQRFVVPSVAQAQGHVPLVEVSSERF